MKIKPNFLICGTCAAGCSQLTAALKQHPEIFFPVSHRPEPHFFYKDQEYEKGLDYYVNKYFSPVTTEKAIGETSGSYMLGRKVPKRIFKNFPEMKLIIQLRNPSLRAYSNYRATVVHGLENLPFIQAIKCEQERIKNYEGIWKFVRAYSYIERSLYFNQLQNFLSIFPKENVLLLKSEDTRRDPQLTFKKCFEFLDIDTEFVPILPPTYSSRSVINSALQMEIRNKIGTKIDLVIDYIEKEKNPLEIASSEKEKELISQLQLNLEKDLVPLEQEGLIYLNNIFLKERDELSKVLPFNTDEWYL